LKLCYFAVRDIGSGSKNDNYLPLLKDKLSIHMTEVNFIKRIFQVERVLSYFLEPLRPLWYILVAFIVIGALAFVLDGFIAPERDLIPDSSDDESEEESLLGKQEDQDDGSVSRRMWTRDDQHLRRRTQDISLLQRKGGREQPSPLHGHMFAQIEKAMELQRKR